MKVKNLAAITEEKFTASVRVAIDAAKKAGFYNEFAAKADEAGIQL